MMNKEWSRNLDETELLIDWKTSVVNNYHNMMAKLNEVKNQDRIQLWALNVWTLNAASGVNGQLFSPRSCVIIIIVFN